MEKRILEYRSGRGARADGECHHKRRHAHHEPSEQPREKVLREGEDEHGQQGERKRGGTYPYGYHAQYDSQRQQQREYSYTFAFLQGELPEIVFCTIPHTGARVKRAEKLPRTILKKH